MAVVCARQPRRSGHLNKSGAGWLVCRMTVVELIETMPTTDPRRDFETWYRKTWPELAGAMAAITGDRAAGEDIAAQALARAYERWDKIDSPSAWTYRVAVNLARRRWRLRLREAAVLHRLTERGVIEIPQIDPDVWSAVTKLPNRQRIAVVLRYLVDLQQNEIAAIMGIAPGSVAATLHSARANLRVSLTPDQTQPRTPPDG